MLVLSVFTGMIAANGEDVSNESHDDESVGKAFIKLKYELDTEKAFTHSEMDELQSLGWTVEEDQIFRLSKVQEAEIEVNGIQTPVNDGLFEVEGSPDTIDIRTPAGTYSVSRNSEGEYILVHEEDFYEMMDSMDRVHLSDEHGEISPLSYGKKYSPGEWVHCNRFNGPLSDDVHYDKAKNPFKAVRNFTGSDCDMALLRWLKCYSHDHCNIEGPAAACSTHIGHSALYHRH